MNSHEIVSRQNLSKEMALKYPRVCAAVDLDAIGVRDKWVRVKETLFAKTIVNRFLDKAVSYDQFYLLCQKMNELKEVHHKK